MNIQYQVKRKVPQWWSSPVFRFNRVHATRASGFGPNVNFCLAWRNKESGGSSCREIEDAQRTDTDANKAG